MPEVDTLIHKISIENKISSTTKNIDNNNINVNDNPEDDDNNLNVFTTHLPN